jgi:hypothetical protein
LLTFPVAFVSTLEASATDVQSEQVTVSGAVKTALTQQS